MNMNLQLALDLAYNQLNTVAQSPEYWTILNSIFGANYNSVLAQTLQQEWQAGNFSTLPPVEILNSSILGKANGAYAASNNTIYLADTFVATATSAQLVAVLLEEIGHAVDAKINSSDTPGDEGELFSLLVRGITPSATELSRIQSENDQAIITLNGQPVAIEMAAAEPTVAWAKSFGSIYRDIPNSITVDSSGNVYTTGSSILNPGWTIDFDLGPGTSNVTSAGDDDVFIIKLNSDGSTAWVKRFGGTGNDFGVSIKLDSSGNIYTTGGFQGTVDFDPGTGTSNLTSAGYDNVFVSKLNSDGSFAWAKSFAGGNHVKGYSIQVDSSGNVYTAGWFSVTADFDPGPGTYNLTASGNFDGFIYKLNSDGSFAWAKNYGSAQDEGGSTITVDSSGNIYNAGTFGYWGGNTDFGSGLLPRVGQEDIFVMKLTAPITNSAPTITSAATATFAENGTGTVYTVTAT
ncbi:SBBP repeat-containing protein, partial [Dolichospermum sp. ST_sed9]|nr:SBBP repeat-containing protein [Dolichospermum sp. ST_sed9]